MQLKKVQKKGKQILEAPIEDTKNRERTFENWNFLVDFQLVFLEELPELTSKQQYTIFIEVLPKMEPLSKVQLDILHY